MKYKQFLEATRKRRNSKEEGFTLLETAIIVGVIGILAAIAVPLWFKVQAEVNSQPIKADLQAASILIEQEQVDNNGLYPTYVPNEIKQHKTMKSFVYSYSDSRTEFCLQAPSTAGKLFVSSRDKSVTSNPCTESNIAEGSDTPWKAPVVTTPGIPTVTNTWNATQAASVSTISIPISTCTLASEDAGEWGPSMVVQYRATITNNSRAGESFSTPWGTSRTITSPLDGWHPDESVKYEAQARCLISNGIDYSYSSGLSPARVVAIARFVLAAPTFSSIVMGWPTGSAVPNYTAKWSDLYCPVGTKQYRLAILDVPRGAATSASTTWNSWAIQQSANLNNVWTSGGDNRFTLTVGCYMPNGLRIESPNTVQVVANALKPPAIPAGVRSSTDKGNTPVLPNRIHWSATTCDVGTPTYRLIQTAPAGTTYPWQTALTYDPTIIVDTNYTFTVEARCGVGTVYSESSGNAVAHSFRSYPSIPPTPSPIATLGSDALGVSAIKNNRLTWAKTTCAAGATAEYQIQQNRKDNNVLSTKPLSGWVTTESLNIPDAWSNHGSILGFNIQARCTNAQGSSSPTAFSSEYVFTTSIPVPAGTWSYLEVDGYSYMNSNDFVCPTGTTAMYRAFIGGDTTFGSSYTSWRNISDAYMTVGEGANISAKMQTACQGPNVMSAVVESHSKSWQKPLSIEAPVQASIERWNVNYYAVWWTTHTNCPTGTRDHYTNWFFRYNDNGSGYQINTWGQVNGGDTPAYQYGAIAPGGTYKVMYNVHSICRNPTTGALSDGGWTVRGAQWVSNAASGYPEWR